MFASDQYALLDFGAGRRLERFGPWVLDRPCPVADTIEKGHPGLWREAHARFVRNGSDSGEWQVLKRPDSAVGDADGEPVRWNIRHDQLVFELKRTHFGHLGIFPEQAANWDWLAEHIGHAETPPRVLNLFAYTGGSTLACAAAGAEVSHIDAARNTVAWARRNAEISGLTDRPIRWIAEDAVKFAKRSLKRGDRYDAVILDPPSYGHGPRGEVWRLSTHLRRLLKLCAELLSPAEEGALPHPAGFVLFTCHTPGFGPRKLREELARVLGQGRVDAGPMTIAAADGRELPAGICVRWMRT